MFEKILVPLDGSEHSIKALDAAIQIAEKFAGKITLVHVYHATITTNINYEASYSPGMPATTIPVITPEEVSRFGRYAREAGNRILMEGKQRVVAGKIEVDSILREGHVVKEISEVAQERGFSLIVIGARGVSHIREMLLGSVTEGLIHHTSCPILVVK
jgi:nucleotide-binding universal stress UspA family protein